METESVLLTICQSGNVWTDKELQAAKKCLRIRERHNFTDGADWPETAFHVKQAAVRMKSFDELPGVTRTGLTVKQVAEMQRLAEKMKKERGPEDEKK